MEQMQRQEITLSRNEIEAILAKHVGAPAYASVTFVIEDVEDNREWPDNYPPIKGVSSVKVLWRKPPVPDNEL
jgi:hypothetical protein